MHAIRRLFSILALTMLAWVGAAQAQTYTYHVYIDSDLRDTTGCTVSGGGQSFVGADYRLTATVTGSPPIVSGRSLSACAGGSFGAGTALSANYPVGLNNGIAVPGGFADVIELAIGRGSLPGVQPQVRVGFAAQSASGSLDILYTATGQVGGPPMIVGSPELIPTLGFVGGLLLALILAGVALRTLKRNRLIAQMLLIGAFFSLGFAAWAANFAADGQVGDWAASSPIGTDPLGDPVPNLSATDIAAVFGADERPNLFFRIDVVDAENQPPVAVGDAYTTLEDQPLTVVAPGVLGNDSDPDGDPITAQLVTGPTRGTLTLNANGSFVYTPNANANGTDTFTYSANDGQVNSTPATVTLTITPVNDVPVFTAGPNQTVLEDAGAQTVNPWATGINDGDPEVTQGLTFTVTGNTNAALFSAAPAISPTGVLTYTPAANANGTATITLRLQDDGGTANGGIDTSATQSFTITVTAVNDAPSFVKGADQTVFEDAGAQTITPWATAISAGPADESGQTLTFNVTGNTNAALFSVAPTVSPTGTLSYTPAANAVGSATITLTLSDNGGTANGGIDTSAAQTFTITVTGVNDAPSFTKGPDQTVLEDAGAQTVTPWATAIDDGDPEVVQGLTFQVTNNSNAALFSAAPAISPTGVLTYTPAANANGTATITLRLQDDGGTANGGVDTSPTQTFVINVTAVNDAPSLSASNPPAVLEDTGAVSIPAWATFTAGPPDEAGQSVLGYQISAISNPALFAVAPAVANNGTLTYTLAANANGSSTFTVRVQDSGGTANGGVDLSAAQTFTVSVTGVNDVPSFTKGPDQTVLEDAGAQTVNPWATAISDGDPEVVQGLTFQVTNNSNAALFSAAPAISPTGVLTYTPAANANGSATITLRLQDDGGTANGGVDTSATQTFVINVTPVNDAPSYTKGADQSVNEDAGAQTANPWATAISRGPADEAGQTLTFNVTGNTNAALFSAAPAVSPTGVLTYTPAANANGVATITLTLSDNGGTANGGVDTSPAQTFTITVNAVNDAPVNTVPGAQSTGDTVPLVLSTANTNAISVADVDAAAGIVQMSFGTGNLANGTLTLANPGAVLTSLTGNGTELVIATGTLTALNTALNGAGGSLTYTPVAGTTAARTITVITNDQGNTGSGGAQIASSTITVNVDAPPVVSSTPASGATIANNAAITVNFSESVNVIAGITLTCGGPNLITGGNTGAAVSSLNLTYTAPLPAGSCTLTVPAASVSDVDVIDPPNNPAATYTATYTVDAAPAFVSGTPAAAAVVNTAQTVSFTYSEPVTDLGGAITLNCGGAVAGAVSGSGTATLTFTPSGPLTAGASCTATAVAAQIGDVDAFDPPQNPVANSTIAFTVDAAPAFVSATPAAAAVVGTGQTVSFTFNENVANLGSAITLNCGAAVTGTISGSGTPTLTFTPSAALTAGASCTATAVAAQIGDSDAIDPPQNPVADVVRNFTVDVAPTVTTTNPANSASSVPLAGVVTINFSENVNFAVGSFTYSCGAAVTFNVAGTGTSTATLTPTANLPINTLCTVTALAAGITDTDAGDPPDNMAADYVFSFTSVNDNPPTVTASTPANAAVVANNVGPLNITFSENINATAGSVTLTCGAGNLITGGTVGANVGTLTPTYTAPLPNGATCTLTVLAANITDADLIDPPDAMVANYVAVFTVDAPPAVTTTTPTNGSTTANNVALAINFNEPVDATNAVTLTCGGPNLITGGASGTAVSVLNPTYTAPLPAGACVLTVLAAAINDSDLADPPANLVANTVINFTVDAAPSVTGGAPANAAANIGTGTTVTYTFDEAVTATANAITLNCGGAITGVVSGSGSNTLTFTPGAALPANTACTATAVATEITDVDAFDPPNNLAANSVRTFTTDAAPTVTTTNPANSAINVPLAGVVTINFSEAVNFAVGSFSYNCGSAVTFTVAGTGTNAATLTPTSLLPINTLCTVTALAAGITDTDAGDPPDNMAANYVFSFTSVNDNPPAVSIAEVEIGNTFTSLPLGGGLASDSNTQIRLTFSEPITATGPWAQLLCSISGSRTVGSGLAVTNLNPVFVLTPSVNLTQGDSCTLTVFAAQVVDDDLIDPPDNMTANYVAGFNVDAAPAVSSVLPGNGASNLATNTTITVNFSEPVNVAAGGVTLNCGAAVTFNGGVLPATNVSSLTLTPSAALPEGATCNGSVVATLVTDVDAGDPPDQMLANFPWSFTTDAAPTVTTVTPAAAAVVSTTQTITANFSENVDLTAAAFTLNCGAAVAFTSVPALPAAATNTITLTPTGGLPQGSACTFTVVAAQVSDSDANDPPNNMAANFVRNFTVDAVPTVVSTTPATGATNVNPTSTISIDFSESMTFDTTANAANTSFDLECPAGIPADFSVTSTSPNDPVVLNPLDSAIAGQTCVLTVRSGAPSNLQDADAIDPPNNLVADVTATIGFGSVANDDAYTVTPHLTLAIGAASPQGGGAVVNDILGAGTITGYGFAPACTGTSPGVQLDAGAANGRFTLNTDGSFSYEPPAGVANSTRTFCYTVTGGDTANIVFTLQNTELVWFVDAAAAGGGIGTQARPFQTIAAVDAVDTANDTVYFEFSAGPPYAGSGWTLLAGERVVGKAAGSTLASISGITPIAGSALPALGGSAPTLDCLSVTCITLGSGNTLRGFTVGDSGNAGTDIAGTNFGTLTVGELTLGGNGRALNLTTGTMNGTFIDIDTSGTTNQAININAVGGTWTVTNAMSLTSSGNTVNTVDISNLPAAASIAFVNGMTVAQTVLGAGIRLDTNNAAATVNLGSIAVTTSNGTGLLINGSPVTIIGATSTVSAQGGPALDISTSNLGVAAFATVSSTVSATTGIRLNDIVGTLVMNGGAIATATTQSFLGTGTLGTTSYAGTLTKANAGKLVSITGAATGTVTLSGALSCTGTCTGIEVLNRAAGTITFSNASKTLTTGTNTAVNLDNNDAASINFTGGGLAITTTSGNGFNAINGATGISVTGAANTVASTAGIALNVANTTVGAAGLTFRSISANGATSGIVLNNTGASGSLTVTGTGGAATGGTIQNTTSHGISLTNTLAPSFTNMAITNTGGNGVAGTEVNGFTFASGSIATSGTDGAADRSNIGFDTTAAGTERNLYGAVSITNNSLTLARFHGIRIFNFNGTISSATISGNTITSGTVAGAGGSQGNGINLIAFGNATTVANVTTADITNNIVSNFPGGLGIQVQGGNSNAAGPSGTVGTPSTANIINITANRIAGETPANRMAGEAIVALVNGKGQGNFNISNNGTLANPITNVTGTAISHSAFGLATVTSTINNNIIVANNSLGSQGIGFGLSNTFGVADTPSMTVTVNSNTISAVDGNGILGVARDTNGTLRAKIQNNTVAAPLGGVRPGIRVDSGNGGAGENDTVCVNISGNTSAGSGGTNGIGLRRQNVVGSFTFGVNGMAATATPGVETFINGLNPAGNGTLLISATSGFSNCSLP